MAFIWQLFVLIGMALIANAKVLVQGRFGRDVMRGTVDTLAYNGLLFGFAALSFFVLFFEPRLPAGTTVLLAAAFGLSSVLFQLTYLSAMKCGPVSLTVLISNFSVIPTALFGVVAYGEEFTLTKAAGLLLVIVSFFLTARQGGEAGVFSWRWLLLALSAAFSSSFGMILQKIHQHTAYSEERTLFVTYAYGIAFLASLVSVLVLAVNRRTPGFRLSPSLLLPTAGAGVLLGVYQVLSLWLAKRMDSMVMYPINSSLTVLVSFLFGIVFFRDRLTRRQWIGSAAGIAAVVLIGC